MKSFQNVLHEQGTKLQSLKIKSLFWACGSFNSTLHRWTAEPRMCLDLQDGSTALLPAPSGSLFPAPA